MIVTEKNIRGIGLQMGFDAVVSLFENGRTATKLQLRSIGSIICKIR